MGGAFFSLVFFLCYAVLSVNAVTPVRRIRSASSKQQDMGPAEEGQPARNVAMMMTGLTRSLRFQVAVDLLKNNFFDALADGGRNKLDSFWRLSVDDHSPEFARPASTGIEARFADEQHEDLRKHIETLIAPLHPQVIVWYEAGSDQATKEESTWFPGIGDQAARVAHPRLYSQFFNRWLNYHQALDHEAKAGIRYDWFVVSRVDLMWIAKQPPLSFFDQSKVTVSSLWNWHIPDIVMMIPREFGDDMHSMSHLGQDCCYYNHYGCSQTATENQEMMSLKFSEELTSQIHSQCCASESSPENCAGGEMALKVSLAKKNIPITQHPFDTTLAHFLWLGRLVLNNECWRLSYHFSAGATRQTANNGSGVSVVSVAACHAAHAYFQSCISKNDSLCEPPRSLEAGNYFMPYAITSKSIRECLTVDGASTKLSPCVSSFFAPSHFSDGVLADEQLDKAEENQIAHIKSQAYFPVKSASGRGYHLQASVDSIYKCLSLRGDDLKLSHDASVFELRPCDNGDERQEWTLTRSSDGLFSLEMPELKIQMNDWNLEIMSNNKDNR
jgi:hypothetical protein